MRQLKSIRHPQERLKTEGGLRMKKRIYFVNFGSSVGEGLDMRSLGPLLIFSLLLLFLSYFAPYTCDITAKACRKSSAMPRNLKNSKELSSALTCQRNQRTCKTWCKLKDCGVQCKCSKCPICLEAAATDPTEKKRIKNVAVCVTRVAYFTRGGGIGDRWLVAY